MERGKYLDAEVTTAKDRKYVEDDGRKQEEKKERRCPFCIEHTNTTQTASKPHNRKKRPKSSIMPTAVASSIA